MEVVDGEQVVKTLMGRKGLPKFFDISPDFLDPAYRYEDSNLSSDKVHLKNYQLASALKYFLSGCPVEVIKTLKANGENAQISWCTDLSAWVVASKNVGIVVRHRDDIASYSKDKYGFAMEIGLVWMDKVDSMSEKGLLEQFKKELGNKTLVGEYIGNVGH